MKRLLALILSLLLCVGLLVSCDKEEESSQESTSSTADEEQNNQNEIKYMIDEPYRSYDYKYVSSAITQELGEEYKIWKLATYEEYREFFEKAIAGAPDNSIAEKGIKESDFDENIVIALSFLGAQKYRFGEISLKVGNADASNEYVMMAECVYFFSPDDVQQDIDPDRKICYVLVPKSNVSTSSIKKVDIICFHHFVNTKTGSIKYRQTVGILEYN